MRRREEYAFVLDTLSPEEAQSRLPPRVRREFPRDEMYVQAVGDEHFTLLLLTVKRGAEVNIGERVYIGQGVRDKIDKIVMRLRYDDLTPQAREILPKIVEMIVREKEAKFVQFFNNSGPLTLKLHSLELLRGIGKKTLNTILEERRRKPFVSYEDIRSRVGINVVELLVDRIMLELQGTEQYYLFTAPPP